MLAVSAVIAGRSVAAVHQKPSPQPADLRGQHADENKPVCNEFWPRLKSVTANIELGSLNRQENVHRFPLELAALRVQRYLAEPASVAARSALAKPASPVLAGLFSCATEPPERKPWARDSCDTGEVAVIPILATIPYGRRLVETQADGRFSSSPLHRLNCSVRPQHSSHAYLLQRDESGPLIAGVCTRPEIDLTIILLRVTTGFFGAPWWAVAVAGSALFVFALSSVRGHRTTARADLRRPPAE